MHFIFFVTAGLSRVQAHQPSVGRSGRLWVSGGVGWEPSCFVVGFVPLWSCMFHESVVQDYKGSLAQTCSNPKLTCRENASNLPNQFLNLPKLTIGPNHRFGLKTV